MINKSTTFVIDGKEFDIIKLIQDNKALYMSNKDLKNQLNQITNNTYLHYS